MGRDPPKTESVLEDDDDEDDDVLGGDSKGESYNGLINKLDHGGEAQRGSNSDPDGQGSGGNEGNDQHKGPDNGRASYVQDMDNKASRDDPMSDSSAAIIIQTEGLAGTEDEVTAAESFRKIATSVPLNDEKILPLPVSSGDARTSRDDELDENEMQLLRDDASSCCTERQQLSGHSTETTPTPAVATPAPAEAAAPEAASQACRALAQESQQALESTAATAGRTPTSRLSWGR